MLGARLASHVPVLDLEFLMGEYTLVTRIVGGLCTHKRGQPFSHPVFTSFHDGGRFWMVGGARLPSLASTSARTTSPRRVALVS